MADWMHCVESGENYEAEYRLRSRDGGYRWFRTSCSSDSRSGREDRQMVWNLFRHSGQQAAGAIDSRQRRRTGENGRSEDGRIAAALDPPYDDARSRAPQAGARSARRVGTGTCSGQNGAGQERSCKNPGLLNRQTRHGLRPAASSIAPFSKSAPCPTSCIHRCSMKSACCRRFPGMLKGSAKRSGIETSLDVQPRDFPRLRPM